jgi:outer membrane protein assembly factor BamB
MTSRFLNIAIAFLILCAGAVAIVWWLQSPPGGQIDPRLPGTDDPSGRKQAYLERRAAEVVHFGEIYERFDTPAPAGGPSWPRFRGPNFNNIAAPSVPLGPPFPGDKPKLLWTLSVAPGYAGAAVHKGRVFLMDHIVGTGDVLRCFTLDTAKEIWRSGYGVDIASNHGITRTVPTVTDRFTVTMGPMGHVMCVDTDSGKLRWGIDLIKEYGTRELSQCWYAGQCPVIDDGIAVIAPVGTDVLMMGVDCETGRLRWTTPHTQNWKMSHSSIVPMTFHGTRMYVYAAAGGVVGIAADEPDRGKLLWESKDWTSSVVMPSPVQVSSNRIFVTSGYGGGSALLEIHKTDDAFSATAVYNYGDRRTYRKCFSTYQHTPILKDGHLFGIQCNDAREHRMQFVCVDPHPPGGAFVWNSDPDTVFTAKGKREAWGPYMLIGNTFFVMGDAGNLVAFEATTERCNKLGEWQLLEKGYETWGPMALAGTKLIIRDIDHLACYEMASGNPPR